jgi:hypothetical protein
MQDLTTVIKFLDPALMGAQPLGPSLLQAARSIDEILYSPLDKAAPITDAAPVQLLVVPDTPPGLPPPVPLPQLTVPLHASTVYPRVATPSPTASPRVATPSPAASLKVATSQKAPFSSHITGLATSNPYQLLTASTAEDAVVSPTALPSTSHLSPARDASGTPEVQRVMRASTRRALGTADHRLCFMAVTFS